MTVMGRFVERLTEASPQDAVAVVNAAAGTLRALSRGQVMSLAQRWYRPLSRLAERTTPDQWKELVEGSWEGPQEILRVLIRAGIRKRTDDPSAHLLAIADRSAWPDMVRETVRVGTLLHTESSRQRWLPSQADNPRPTPPSGPTPLAQHDDRHVATFGPVRDGRTRASAGRPAASRRSRSSYASTSRWYSLGDDETASAWAGGVQ
ncbi:hypothetical protein [Streptomyces canus]|uniref:hypothetical protein n=1 Tax=Streptomyces canus TaxID=58343 RepID=UPI002DDAAC60|nr:hypothetical protein [Streptomyces canus]WSD91899.1 hypothetical protein OG925_49950 [Streptomyces canus]WSD92612.1 hypothetical protein OG925_51010 [Streptomyces canus]